ncbi:MAG: hypothetical protein U5K30_05770 [Acidimicrobiales bacterium]|nr:hypothetical protein [Acidimicrobiales bacterium]
MLNETLPGFEPPVPSTRRRGRTFTDNKRKPIHRWYSFIEGFSAESIRSGRHSQGEGGQAARLRPFRWRWHHRPRGDDGRPPCVDFSEVNPYLAWLALTKTTSVADGGREDGSLEQLIELSARLPAAVNRCARG